MNAQVFRRLGAAWHDWGWRSAVLAIAYVLLGQLGLALAVPTEFAALMWPPAGIAIGALLLYGVRLWPGVYLGAFLLQLMVGGAFFSNAAMTPGLILVPLFIACGATLQPIIARALIVRFIGQPLALQGWHDALRFLVIAGPVSCVVSASIAVPALVGFGVLSADTLATQWRAWWFGDMFGVLVFLPLMLVAPQARSTLAWRGTPVATLSLAALLTLLVPLAVTLYMWRVSERLLQEQATTAFVALASESERALQFRIQSYEQALMAGAGFVLGARGLSRSQWRAFATALDLPNRYPGMHGVGWIAAVRPQQVPDYVARMRALENPQFTIKPEGGAEFDFIITYVEPEARNAQAIGLNIAFERHRREAALHARSSRQATLTRKVQLVQDSLARPGFLLLLPVFSTVGVTTGKLVEDEFLGWLYAPVVGENLVAALTNAQGRSFSLRVFDGEATPEHLIDSSGEREARRGLYQATRTLQVGQQPWTLQWDSTASFEETASTLEPMLILVVGLLSTTLFAAFLLASRQRERAVAGLVHDQSLQLQESQLALQASEATLRAAMEHAPIGMALVDTSGRWLQANRACCEMLGYSLAELKVSDFHGITHPEDLPKAQELLQQVLHGDCSSYEIEKRYLHRNGHYVWAQLAIALVRDTHGVPQYLVAQILDITQRREMDRMKSEFISTVSHELRTPLTSIRGSLGLLDSGRLGSIPAKASQMVRIAHSNCERLIRIINDILDIDKFESGRPDLAMEPVALAGLLRQSVDANLAYAQKYSIELELRQVSSEVRVLADPDRLMQVMANLLSNAAKFSHSGSHVIIRATPNAESVVIEVQDFGGGIPENFHARVFEKFVQAESSAARRFEGTGLGLAISKQLVEAMGGTISFTSSAAEGTTFKVMLRRAIIDRPRLEPLHLQTTPHLKVRNVPRILHVEDDQDLSRVLQVGLAGRAELVRAGTLREARLHLRKGGYGLLLIDFSLPDGDGAQLVEEWGAQIPIVVLSVAEASASVRVKVHACLIKSKTAEPVIIEHLLDAVNASVD
jgi:PAS domain S-box-containing protein